MVVKGATLQGPGTASRTSLGEAFLQARQPRKGALFVMLCYFLTKNEAGNSPYLIQVEER